MLPLLAKINPIKVLLYVAGISLLVIIGILTWRVSYLSDKVSDQKVAINGYKATISDLRHHNEVAERVTLADRDDSIRNEIDRAEIVGDINATETEYGCSDVVHDTIEWLRNSTSTTDD